MRALSILPWLLLALPGAWPGAQAPGAATAAAPQAGPSIVSAGAAARERAKAPLAKGVAAVGLDASLSFAELEPLLLMRFAMGVEGQKVLEHLLKMRLLEVLCREQGLTVSESDVQARFSKIDADARAAGSKGIEREVAANGLSLEYFRGVLRLAIAQERLAKQALGMASEAPISAEQLEIWLEETLQKRKFELLPRPWPLDERGAPIAARCQGVEISAQEFASALANGLPFEDVRESCYQLLLEKLVLERLAQDGRTPSPEQLETALDKELERRRSEIQSDPRYKGIAWDQLLIAQGLDPARMREDSAVRVAALATYMVDTVQGEAGLKSTYETEREFFEGRFGEALRLRLCYLRATSLPNQLIPRDYSAATQELEKRAKGVQDEASFIALAEVLGDEPALKKVGGDLGWTTRADTRVSQELRDFVFAEVAQRPLPVGGRLAGPYSLSGGVGLVWIGERRGSPAWEQMRVNVHRELRRRFLEDVLPRAEVRTFLDVNE